MPAKSKSQLRAVCAKSPKLCREFAVSGSAFKKLPERVKKKKR